MGIIRCTGVGKNTAAHCNAGFLSIAVASGYFCFYVIFFNV
jgi:hypothetical protein